MDIKLITALVFIGIVSYCFIGFFMSLIHRIVFFESELTDGLMCLIMWPFLLLHLLLYFVLNILKYIKKIVIEIIKMFKEW